jgi:hypothetical protein
MRAPSTEIIATAVTPISQPPDVAVMPTPIIATSHFLGKVSMIMNSRNYLKRTQTGKTRPPIRGVASTSHRVVSQRFRNKKLSIVDFERTLLGRGLLVSSEQ